jgi:hypothetical protein
MNRLDMQVRLQNFFNNPAYYTSIDMNDSIQDGLDEVVAFSGCVYKSAVVHFQQNLTYYNLLQQLPDYLGLVAMFNNVIKRWMFASSVRKFQQDRIDWECVYGTPQYFSVVNHRYVAIYRKPSVPNYGDMIVYYRAAAPLLDDSTKIPIPEDHINVLEDYVITDLWEQNQEFTKAQDQLAKYQANLEELRKYIRNKRNPDRTMSLR